MRAKREECSKLGTERDLLATQLAEQKELLTKTHNKAEEVEAIVERANETKELNGLLKGMRGLLIEALRG